MNDFIKLIIALALPFCAGAIGSLWTSSSVGTRYVGLVKPTLNPPSRVFGPVWTILYILMGISLYLVLKKGVNTKLEIISVGVFIIQIILNALWSYLFFGLRSPYYALILILFLFLAILLNIILFWYVNKVSSILLLPYILWVGFATYLNYQIYVLNP